MRSDFRSRADSRKTQKWLGAVLEIARAAEAASFNIDRIEVACRKWSQINCQAGRVVLLAGGIHREQRGKAALAAQRRSNDKNRQFVELRIEPVNRKRIRLAVEAHESMRSG